ncbi:MAG: thiol oxidoreductase [Rhizobiales bacterium]|nr:thiol oxidoreductase [Hyphomicrobiales bacterium]
MGAIFCVNGTNVMFKFGLSTLLMTSSIIMPMVVNAEILTKRQLLTLPTDDFTKVEKFEHYPGGTEGKFTRIKKQALSQPSKSLGVGGGMDFALGKSMFKKLWAPAPAATQASNGLGPLFNARSCLSCHLKHGRGHVPEVGFPNEDANSMLIRLSIKPQNKQQQSILATGKQNTIADPIYGGQLQDIGASGFKPEGRISVSWAYHNELLADGTIVELRKPEFKINELNYGNLHNDIMTSARIATQMVGMGLVESINSADILRLADPDDLNGDGISGKPNMVWNKSGGALALGRFGWKAGQPNLRQQVAAAFSGDVGINTSLFPNPSGDCTHNQQACLEAPNGNTERMGGFELSDELLDLTSFFNANLAVPNRKNAAQEIILLGKKLFYQTGCISCHQPKFVTGKKSIYKNLHNELIWPYSDFLLHDMGEGLSDNRPEGKASGNEWRTPPLWALGASKYMGKNWQLLHDGRARNVEEAILWHDGEASKVKQQYKTLSSMQRNALKNFVESL